MTTAKSNLRHYLLSKRRSLSNEAWRNGSAQICDHLRHFPPFQNATTILSYVSHRQEPDLSGLLSLAKIWGLPRCVEGRQKTLAWHHYQPGDRLISGQYGIAEPHPDLPPIDIEHLDLILVPAVGCSTRGDRLGYGGGFYDRFFAGLTQPVITIGIIFECSLMETIPIDPWDIPLDYVCTEKKIYAP